MDSIHPIYWNGCISSYRWVVGAEISRALNSIGKQTCVLIGDRIGGRAVAVFDVVVGVVFTVVLPGRAPKRAHGEHLVSLEGEYGSIGF